MANAQYTPSYQGVCGLPNCYVGSMLEDGGPYQPSMIQEMVWLGEIKHMPKAPNIFEDEWTGFHGTCEQISNMQHLRNPTMRM